MAIDEKALEAARRTFCNFLLNERSLKKERFGALLSTDVRDAMRLALEAYESASSPEVTSESMVLVPIELTEDMAAAMECEFSTEAQWAAALAARPTPLPAEKR